jgi:hypothetical protein
MAVMQSTKLLDWAETTVLLHNVAAMARTTQRCRRRGNGVMLCRHVTRWSPDFATLSLQRRSRALMIVGAVAVTHTGEKSWLLLIHTCCLSHRCAANHSASLHFPKKTHSVRKFRWTGTGPRSRTRLDFGPVIYALSISLSCAMPFASAIKFYTT